MLITSGNEDTAFSVKMPFQGIVAMPAGAPARTCTPETTNVNAGLTDQINGALQLGITLGKNPVIIGPPGVCKTSHAENFVATRPQTYMIRCEDAPTDKTIVSQLLCNSLGRGPRGVKPPLVGYRDRAHRTRVQVIRDFLQRNRNAVLVVDEAQKLSANALEYLRDIHDTCGPTPQRPMPIAFFGDRTFKDLIESARGGNGKRLTGQFGSRMYPIFDIQEWAADPSNGDFYNIADLAAVTSNNRLKLLTNGALKWLTNLANIGGEDGLMRRAIVVFQAAVIFWRKNGNVGYRMDVPQLQEAFTLSVGKAKAMEIDALAGGSLLRKVG